MRAPVLRLHSGQAEQVRREPSSEGSLSCREIPDLSQRSCLDRLHFQRSVNMNQKTLEAVNMKILVLAQRHEDTSLETMRPHFKAEVEAVWDLYARGIVREFYTRADNGGPAILSVECDSVDAAKKALAGLPMVANNMIDLDFVPLAPFNGLSHLWDDTH